MGIDLRFGPRLVAAAAVLTAAAVGCEPAAPPTAPVGGVVTLGGEPLPGVEVRFLPVRAEGEEPKAISVGVTDDFGRYALEYRGRDVPTTGAAVGPHKVTLNDRLAEEARDPVAVPDRIPPRYSNGALSPLAVTVAPPAGDPPAEQTIDLELTAG